MNDWYWAIPLMTCLLFGPFILIDLIKGVYGPWRRTK